MEFAKPKKKERIDRFVFNYQSILKQAKNRRENKVRKFLAEWVLDELFHDYQMIIQEKKPERIPSAFKISPRIAFYLLHTDMLTNMLKIFYGPQTTVEKVTIEAWRDLFLREKSLDFKMVMEKCIGKIMNQKFIFMTQGHFADDKSLDRLQEVIKLMCVPEIAEKYFIPKYLLAVDQPDLARIHDKMVYWVLRKCKNELLEDIEERGRIQDGGLSVTDIVIEKYIKSFNALFRGTAIQEYQEDTIRKKYSQIRAESENS